MKKAENYMIIRYLENFSSALPEANTLFNFKWIHLSKH